MGNLQDKLHEKGKSLVIFFSATDESITSHNYLWGKENFDMIELLDMVLVKQQQEIIYFGRLKKVFMIFGFGFSF